MDWYDCYLWWVKKYRPAGPIAFADFLAVFDAWSDGEAIWQAAFDGVLAGVDDELIAGVAIACDLARLDNCNLYNSDIVYAWL